jgi:hypothetical protein
MIWKTFEEILFILSVTGLSRPTGKDSDDDDDDDDDEQQLYVGNVIKCILSRENDGECCKQASFRSC